MSNQNQITLEQLNAELERLSKAMGGEGLSLVEMVAQTGLAAPRLNKTLKTLHDAGRLRVGRKKALAIDGTMRMVPSYVILPEPKTPKKRK